MNKKILLRTRMKLLNALVRSRLAYSCQTWTVTQGKIKQLRSYYGSMIRKMVKGGYRRHRDSWRFILSNEDLMKISKTEDITEFIKRQQRKYTDYVIRKEITSTSKRLMFNDDRIRKTGPKTTLLKSTIKNTGKNENKLHQERDKQSILSYKPATMVWAARCIAL